MLNGLQTIWYFTWRGLAYGVAIGALAGTFIFPLYATFIGFFYGGAVGLVMGFLLGIGVHFYNKWAYRNQVEFADYQTNLVTYAGLATAIITALPLLFVLAPIAGLAAAYITHRYADDHAHHIFKRKNDALLPDTLQHMEKPGSINQFSDRFFAKASKLFFPLLVLANLGVVAIELTNPFFIVSIGSILTIILMATIGWSIYYLLVVPLVGVTNGMFIQMLNRVVFSPEMTLEQYKRRVMITAGLFTLVITPIVGFGIGAPILAILAALAARDYADWHFGEHHEKSKRDAARLAEIYDDTDDELSEDDDMPALYEKINRR